MTRTDIDHGVRDACGGEVRACSRVKRSPYRDHNSEERIMTAALSFAMTISRRFHKLGARGQIEHHANRSTIARDVDGCPCLHMQVQKQSILQRIDYCFEKRLRIEGREMTSRSRKLGSRYG
jgi:hypothetical protein